MKTHKPVEGQSTGGGHLSAEQLRRMEENRRKAREKLAAKRLQPSPSSSHSTYKRVSVPPRGDLGPPPAKRPAIMTNPQHSSAQHKHMLPTTGYHGNHLRQFPQTSRSSSHEMPITSNSHCPVSKPRTFPPAVPSSATDFYTNPKSTVRTSTVSQKTQVPKFAPLQAKIKANMVLISRARFKVVVPYDSTVIELFKKMPTKSYGKCYQENTVSVE